MRERQPVECINCGSEELVNIDSERDPERGILTLEMWCLDCGQKWYEVYNFVQVENEMGDEL